MDIRDKNSLLTEWVLKFAVIFFVASVFFQSYIVESFADSPGFHAGFLLKLIIVLVYGIFLSILEKNIFKVVAFVTIITGAVFKLLIYISLDDFSIVKITDIADYLLLIGVSVYYLFRHFRSSKKKKKPKDHHPSNKKKHYKKHGKYPRYTKEDVKAAYQQMSKPESE